MASAPRASAPRAFGSAVREIDSYMSDHPLEDEARPVWIAPRERIIAGATAAIAAGIGMPFVMQLWAPTWFAAAWVITYLTITALFLPLVVNTSSYRIEQAWAIVAGLLYAAVPLSTIAWDRDPEYFWISVAVGIIFISFEMSALPFLNIGEWRIGVSFVTAAIVIAGVMTINPWVALLLVPIIAAMISGAQRVRRLKRDLEEHLHAAQVMIHRDELTGLLNRRGLDAQIDRNDYDKITLVMLDMDRFKLINDTHGYQIGDVTLAALGAELAQRLPASFSVARFGGDEFVAFSPGHVELPDSVVAPLSIETELHGQRLALKCRLSGGITFGDSSVSTDRLLSEAGFALREAKSTGGRLSVFGGALRGTFDRTLELASVASIGSEAGEFVPFGQTIIGGDSIIGTEMLIRWRRPDGAVVSPAEFLPLASANGMMPAIDNQMLEHAIEFAARFNNRPVAPFVSVNITANHLHSEGFTDRVRQLLADYRVPASRLMIEITESEYIDGSTDWATAASDLRAQGVLLAIDDFGSGYSSIERLRHLPVSHLKFDRSLVQTVSGPFGEIVRGVARYAAASNISVIAEGIETLDELETMRAIGVDTFQGYLFHRPRSLDDVEQTIIADQVRQTATADASRRSNHD